MNRSSAHCRDGSEREREREREKLVGELPLPIILPKEREKLKRRSPQTDLPSAHAGRGGLGGLAPVCCDLTHCWVGCSSASTRGGDSAQFPVDLQLAGAELHRFPLTDSPAFCLSSCFIVFFFGLLVGTCKQPPAPTIVQYSGSMSR